MRIRDKAAYRAGVSGERRTVIPEESVVTIPVVTVVDVVAEGMTVVEIVAAPDGP